MEKKNLSFYEEVGQMALGTRIRILGDIMAKDATRVYEDYETKLHPKWFPVFYVLSKREENTVTGIAQYIGHSHVSVSKIVAEMIRAGIVTDKKDPADRRRTVLELTTKGREISEKIEYQYADISSAVDCLLDEATHNLWEALSEWEYLLSQKSLFERIIEQRKKRESEKIQIVSFSSEHSEAFYKLNEEWITQYFKMEQPDRDALENPREYILDKGGYISVALLNDEVVGVCGLIKRDDLNCYELAKMAVSPKAQGKSIGYKLGVDVLSKAKELGAKEVYLESNTKLTPAIRLYEKLGFRKIVGGKTPYERCNIQMVVSL